MRLTPILIRNSIRMDFKMLIPFFVTVVLIVIIISSSSVTNELFVAESSEPAIIKYGGDVTFYRSHKPAAFVMGMDGLNVNWYAHLFDQREFAEAAPAEGITYDLSLWGLAKILRQWDAELIGRSPAADGPAWDISRGSVPQDMTLDEWYEAGRPAAVLLGDKVPLEVRNLVDIGSEVYVFVPKVTESGGKYNLKGMHNTVMVPKDADGMDYLDDDNGSWVAFTVEGIVRDGTTGAAGIGFILPLQVLQGLADADHLVNHAGFSMDGATEAEKAAAAAAITENYDGFYGLRTTDMFISSFKSVRNLEQQADMLVYAAYLIGSLMVTCVLVLMLRNRRAADVQLITLGVSRWTLTLVVMFEIFIISLGAVLLGALLPTAMSLIRSHGLAMDWAQIGQLLLIVPFNLLVALVVSRLILPGSKQCLEVLTNE